MQLGYTFSNGALLDAARTGLGRIVALCDCVCTRFTKRFGAYVSEVTMRLDPRR